MLAFNRFKTGLIAPELGVSHFDSKRSKAVILVLFVPLANSCLHCVGHQLDHVAEIHQVIGVESKLDIYCTFTLVIVSERGEGVGTGCWLAAHATAWPVLQMTAGVFAHQFDAPASVPNFG